MPLKVLHDRYRIAASHVLETAAHEVLRDRARTLEILRPPSGKAMPALW